MATKPKVLIANRGEIAVRIIRTCRDLGIPTVAVYSDADRDALHVELADQGPPDRPGARLGVIPVDRRDPGGGAEVSSATMIHPGYGFLAERAHFAQAVEEAGFTFVGPSAQAIEHMGDKAAAGGVPIAAACPIVPGTPEPVDVRRRRSRRSGSGSRSW